MLVFNYDSPMILLANNNMCCDMISEIMSQHVVTDYNCLIQFIGGDCTEIEVRIVRLYMCIIYIVLIK